MSNRIVVVGAILLVLCWRVAFAQDVTVTQAFTIPPNETAVVDVACPPGYELGVIVNGATPGDTFLPFTRGFFDAQGTPIQFGGGAPSGATRLIQTTTNATPKFQSNYVTVICRPISGAVELVADAVAVAPGGTVKVDALCNPGQVPVGQISNTDGTTLLQRSRAFIFLEGGNYSFLEDAPDGEIGPPVGIQLEIRNATTTQQTARVQTSCQSLPGARTFVSSAPTTPGQPFSLAGVAPDAYAVRGYSVVGGLYGAFSSFAIWGTDGSVSTQARFASPTGALPPTPVRNFFAEGVDARPKSAAKAAARAVIGVLAVPRTTPPPAPGIVTVVEFYNDTLDHYFITAAAQEIVNLDTGVLKGWQRTGRSFKAYGPGSSGPPGRRPVCRAYGDPLAGLDTHFYSASPSECATTFASFNGVWKYEAAEVFQMVLPDVVTGGCPLGSVPVYRLWNQRTDSNHRYVTTLALRDEMVGKGYVPEGYGPNSVTLCGVQ